MSNNASALKQSFFSFEMKCLFSPLSEPFPHSQGQNRLCGCLAHQGPCRQPPLLLSDSVVWFQHNSTESPPLSPSLSRFPNRSMRKIRRGFNICNRSKERQLIECKHLLYFRLHKGETWDRTEALTAVVTQSSSFWVWNVLPPEMSPSDSGKQDHCLLFHILHLLLRQGPETFQIWIW